MHILQAQIQEVTINQESCDLLVNFTSLNMVNLHIHLEFKLYTVSTLLGHLKYIQS